MRLLSRFRLPLAGAVLLAAALAAPAEPRPAGDAVFRVTINPEARVSVVQVGEIPAEVACGSPVILPVRVTNQGFVTAPLEASLVDAPAGVALDFPVLALKGAREETRVLRLTLARPGTVDLTLAFRTRNEIPDLNGRDRLHFLIRAH